MRHLFLLLFLVVVAAGVGYALQQQEGYILLGYHNVTMQLPLWMAAVGLVLFVIVIYYLLRFLSFLFGIVENWRIWRGKRRVSRSHAHTLAGYVALLQADWSKVEKRFATAATYNPNLKFVHYIGAAVASHLAKSDNVQEYLALAHQEGTSEAFIADLAHAYLLMRDQDYEKSLAILRHLQEQSPKNPLVLYLLENVLMSVQDWQGALDVLALLEKNHIISGEEYVNRASLLYMKLFDQGNKNAESLQTFWNKIPKSLRANPNLLGKYVELLHGKGHDDELVKLLLAALDREWSENLIRWYGKVKSSSPKKQFDNAEYWLKKHDNDAELLLALGRLAKLNQWWGKSRSYLTTSLQIKPQATTYAEMAELAQAMNEPALAQQYYREGLLFVTKAS